MGKTAKRPDDKTDEKTEQKRANPFPEYRHRNTATTINTTKQKHRSSLTLRDWTKDNYFNRPEVLDRLGRLDKDSHVVAEVEDGKTTVEEVRREYLIKERPVLIKDGCSRWPAMREGRWRLETLYKRFKHTEFKIGECDEGRKIRSKYKYFYDYMINNEDDSPLYLFESGMDYAVEHASLLKDYDIPKYFPSDFLNLCGREHKPPYRWFCIGPQRSGTTVHKDPLSTHAWNAVVSGRKRWVLFEPQVSKEIATGKAVREKGEGSEGIHYFDFLLPRIKIKFPDVKVYECIQEPGDIIFVPGGWWHGVVNLEHAVAVTQNYCGPENFDKVYIRMLRDRPGLCKRFESNMKRWTGKSLYKRSKWLKKHQEDFPHGETSESSSDSDSDSSEYSSSDEEEDIDWTGLTRD